MFGIHKHAEATELGILPESTPMGIEIMSLNLLTQNETDPMIWRGPVIANLVTQFWTNVVWNDIDVLFIDMPPGTGDVPLTIFQSIPVDGIVVVTSPQDLVSMIVEKAVNMAKMMNIPILGLVENMSYLNCPCCGEKINVYGESTVDEVAKRFGVDVISKIPIMLDYAKLSDEGLIEYVDGDPMANIIKYLD